MSRVLLVLDFDHRQRIQFFRAREYAFRVKGAAISSDHKKQNPIPWTEAKALFEGLHSDVPDNIAYLGYLGATAARMEDKEGAQKISKQLEKDQRPYLFGAPTIHPTSSL